MFLNEENLWKNIRVLSISQDNNGKEFIAMAEAYEFPFYGI